MYNSFVFYYTDRQTMEIVKQIKQICIETDNKWFLTHQFTKVGLCDLQLKETLEKEKIRKLFSMFPKYKVSLTIS